MSEPINSIFEITDPSGGVVYSCENHGEHSKEPRYACITAPVVISCEVRVDNTVVDKVWAGNGGSHSWWKEAGGGLLKYPLKPGQKMEVILSGPGAFRIDWY